MSYIGKQPVPQSLQSRQQFTGDGSTTDFATIGGVELYEDVFLNGVRLSRVDNEYSFDGTTLTITPAPANGDTVSIILRNDHSDLVALPITDSQGNNVLSESGGVVTLGSVTLGGTVTNDTNVIGFRKRLASPDVTSSGIMTYSAIGAYINGMTESSGTITIQKAGRYFAYVSLYISHSSTSTDYISVMIRKNTTTEIGSGANNYASTVAKRETINTGGLINLAVDDTVDVYLTIAGSGTVFEGIGSEFHLFYVGQ